MPRRALAVRRSRRGLTMVELMVTLIVLTVCGYLLSATITATVTQNVAKREQAIAAEAARNVFEDMRNEAFAFLFATYNEDPADDPLGPGSAVGKHFFVEGLQATADDPDGLAGEIILPAVGPPLREDVEDDLLAFPRDLNGDTRIDELDHSKDYILMPVNIRIDWEGFAGRRSFQMSTMLADLSKL